MIFTHLTESFDSYSDELTWKYIKLKRAIKKVVKNKKCQLCIMSKFNKKHYPVIDIDDGTKLSEIINKVNSEGIAYVLFESSPNHYWMILDYGNENFYESNKILTGLGVLGDKEYYKVSLNYKRYFIRAEYSNLERIPHITSDYDTINLSIPKPITLRSWKSSYVKTQILLLPFSDNFSRFVNKLKEYYNNDIHTFSKFNTTYHGN